jgi:Zn-dependent protease with chaperone function
VTFSLVWPGLLAVAVGVALGHVQWPLRPRLGAVILAVVIAGTSLVAVALVVATAGGWVLSQPGVMALVERCPLVPAGHDVGWIVGLPALVATVWMARRVRNVVSLRRWASAASRGHRFQVLDTPEPIAYAAPGHPGCVVVSVGMFDALEPAERTVLLAHEEAHLTQRHHRYLMVAELGLAVVPVLRPLTDQLRLAVERCADEAAVTAVGGDRGLVARAIARGALAKTTYQPALAPFSGATVPLRIEALVGAPPRPWLLIVGSCAAAIALIGDVGALVVQGHHLALAIVHVCHS